MGDNVGNLYEDAKFTADISSRMRVPDKIQIGESTHNNDNNSTSSPKVNDLGMRQRDPRIDMRVPDEIMLAPGGTIQHSISLPRELQLENSVMPPTSEHVRVSTPPRSIRLEEHAFPSASDAGSPTRSSNTSRSTPTFDAASSHHAAKSLIASSQQSESGGFNQPPRENLSPLEEIQLLRRQMAKLNHRLMAVEAENQQQQQREMILTLLVSAYLIGKVAMWINRSL